MGGPTEFVGKVLSNKMQKSVLVAIEGTKAIPKYRTTIRRTTKLMAHDANDECQVGDTVRIRLCRPLSKNKSYTVIDVLQKSKVLHLGGAQGYHSFASSSCTLLQAQLVWSENENDLSENLREAFQKFKSVGKPAPSMVQSITTNAAQQHAIRTHLSSPCICPEPLFIHGPASTGKTCDMKAILSSLPDHCLSVYIDCVEFCTARSIYGAIVSKLGKELHSMTASKSKKRALESSSFFSSSRAVVTNQAQFATHVGELLKEYRDMKVWIVLDNVDRVCSRAGASSGTDAQVLSVLDHLGEALSVDVGLVMISQVAWSSGMFAASTSRVGKGTRDPTVIEYTAYSPADLERICLTSDSFKCKGKNHYKSYFQQFVKSMVPLLSRATNNLMDVQNALRKIWKVYIAPVKTGGSMPTNWQHNVLFSKVKGMVTEIVRDLDVKGRSIDDTNEAAGNNKNGGVGGDNPGNKATVSMGLFAKYIVVASYLASRNKPTTDKAIFDPGYTRGKRVRKNAQALDRQSEQALEMRLRGSHPFPLERMLHIFYYICEPPRDESVERWSRKMQEVDVLMLVSTLCSMGLLTCLSPDTLSQPSYKSNVSDEMAYAVAAELNLTLNTYLKLA